MPRRLHASSNHAERCASGIANRWWTKHKEGGRRTLHWIGLNPSSAAEKFASITARKTYLYDKKAPSGNTFREKPPINQPNNHSFVNNGTSLAMMSLRGISSGLEWTTG